MTEADRMRRVEELFHGAVELPPAERAVWVERATARDDALRQDVLELLQAEFAVREVIASAAARSPEPPLPPDANAEESWAGRIAGNYRLMRLLGRGGMGVVYLAERADGAGQPVAIKFMRRSLHVAAGSPALEQFLLERDGLAALQHPNIARLLDAGVAEGFGGVGEREAVPYVVMEFVEGQRLDHACDAPATSSQTGQIIAGRMLALCEAVSFAHRNLVLHRDLKPSNVLVSSDGAVKLLDFGTLKMLRATDAGVTDPSAMTQAGMRPLTLRYAAPEHVFGHTVTTASDVYSLGIVLYRLLAGALPPELDRNSSQPGAGLLGWFEHLKAGTVTPPSKLSPRKLPRELAEDLDAIALKAMRYEPEARYTSAQAMADDLRFALEGQPVRARGESTRYRLRRWYARNRGLFWAGAAAACVLFTGVLVMQHETGIARAEERTASAGVEQERQLAHTLLFDYFTQLQQITGSTDAQRQAVTQANTYLDTLAATNPSEAVALETVRGYTAMGTLLGSPYYQNLGDPPGALRTLKKALALGQALLKHEPGNVEFQQAVAATYMVMGQVELGSGKPREAVGDLQAASGTYIALAERPGADIKAIISATNVMNNLGDAYSQRGNGTLRDPAKAIAIFDRVLVLYHGCEPLDPTGARCSRGVAIADTKLGQLYEDTDVIKARSYYDRALAWLRRLPAAEQKKTPVQRSYGILRVRLIVLNAYENRMDLAQPMIDQEREIDQKAIAADPLDARALFDLAALDASLMDAFFLTHNHASALSSSAKYLETANKLVALQPDNASWAYLKAQATLQHGRALLEAGDRDGGMREANRGFDLILPLAKAPDAEPDTLNTAAQYLAYFHRDAQKEGSMAVTFAQRALAATGAASTSDDFLLLSQTQRYAGQLEASRESAINALKVLEQHPNSLGHAADVAEAQELLKT